MQFVDNCGHDVQDLRFSSIRDIPIIVDQNSLEEWRDHVCIHHFQVISFLHVSVDELQDFLLDSSKPANFRCLSGNVAYNGLTHCESDDVSRNEAHAVDLPSCATASLMSWLEARYIFSMSW